MSVSNNIELWKMNKAWDLASRVMPELADSSGDWSEAEFTSKAGKVLASAYKTIQAAFPEPPDPFDPFRSISR